MRSAPWTIVTREPNRAKICANSSPTGPPPTTSSDSGNSVNSSADTWSIQSISSMPSIGGTAVREPVAIRIRSARSSSSPTRTEPGPSSSASPVVVSNPASWRSAIHFASPFLSVSLRALTRARSSRRARRRCRASRRGGSRRGRARPRRDRPSSACRPRSGSCRPNGCSRRARRSRRTAGRPSPPRRGPPSRSRARSGRSGSLECLLPRRRPGVSRTTLGLSARTQPPRHQSGRVGRPGLRAGSSKCGLAAAVSVGNRPARTMSACVPPRRCSPPCPVPGSRSRLDGEMEERRPAAARSR